MCHIAAFNLLSMSKNETYNFNYGLWFLRGEKFESILFRMKCLMPA